MYNYVASSINAGPLFNPCLWLYQPIQLPVRNVRILGGSCNLRIPFHPNRLNVPSRDDHEYHSMYSPQL